MDRILSSGHRRETIEISTSLIVAFKSARTKYEEVKHAMKKDKKKSEEENLTNQLGIQIKQLKSKLAEINKTLHFLDEEFTEYIFNAASKSSTEQSQLIAKTTALKCKNNVKKEEIRELEEQIKVLEMKRKKG